MSENAIVVQQATKRYGRNEVLKNVSFDVPNGVVFALLGENGAGKSTLIRSMMGYQRLNSGTISVCGLDPNSNALQLRRMVGYVSDAPAMYEWMTVADAGWYASGFYTDGFLANYQRMTEAFRLPAATKIKDLSKGMRAKVALSLAIAFNPDLLILDEPTSGLDPLVRREFLESMIDRAAVGKTVFLSSHQIQEVERVADWVAILHEGVVQVVAPLESLKTDVSVLEFSLRDPLIALPIELDQAQIMHRSQSGRSFHLLVRGLDSGLVPFLRSQPNVIEASSHRPSLEELYLGFTQPENAVKISQATKPLTPLIA